MITLLSQYRLFVEWNMDKAAWIAYCSISVQITIFILKFRNIISSGVAFCCCSEWQNEQLPPVNILRLIYQGRFLHDNVTLGGECVFR